MKINEQRFGILTLGHCPPPPPINYTYFNRIIIESIQDLRAHKHCYVFQMEHIEKIQLAFPKLKYIEVSEGIYKLWR